MRHKIFILFSILIPILIAFLFTFPRYTEQGRLQYTAGISIYQTGSVVCYDI